MEMKRKTPLQLQSLEDFYSEDKYPTQKAIKDFAAASGLAFKQVQGWFVEKRRRDKKIYEVSGLACSGQTRSKTADPLSSRSRHTSSTVEKRIPNAKRIKRPTCLQDMLFSPDYILKKVFRKDGPPLGVEFDSFPRGAPFHFKTGSSNDSAFEETPSETRKRKGFDGGIMDHAAAVGSCTVKKHGMGKGLMTVWRAANPDGGDFPVGVDFAGETSGLSQITRSLKTSTCKRPKKQRPVAKMVKDKQMQKKKPLRKKKVVPCSKDPILKSSRMEKCKLALEEVMTQEHLDQFAMLVDDEDLEMRELQAGPNPLSCSGHLASNELHGCLLCKDLLAKFPPSSVKMKQPFSMQPWDSSLEMVKKLLKAFHFLYTYSVMLDINSFTLDEFAQAFHDKDSLLLGEIHLALLKVLFVDIEVELSGGTFRHSSKSCKFLALIHSVDSQESVVELWRKFLNPLTWTEILRQVLIAAGFGSNQSRSQGEAIDEEVSHMRKYGLNPGTLKGELFRLLSGQGSNGLKVSEMARSSPIVGLNLSSATEDLEVSICSTLSSDITLFEKISSSTYRLRVNFSSNDDNDLNSDTEDSGTVDDRNDDSGMCSSSYDSECESDSSKNRKSKHFYRRKSRNSMLMIHSEIDESHPGEPWLLGLMEGEYSDLSIEEKLNALVALVDLLSAGSTIKMEDPNKSLAENAPASIYSGSGAKIKRASTHEQKLLRSSWIYDQPRHGTKLSRSSSEIGPVDSSVTLTKLCNLDKFSSRKKDTKEEDIGSNLHPMQSVFLGSDRRYNRYWLFLGPCNAYDPGHKRVYFESSEDGSWKVIDTAEALCALFSVLDDRGAREALLIKSLGKRKAFISQEMSSQIIDYPEVTAISLSGQSELDMATESSSPISDVDNGLSIDIDHGDSLPQPGAIVLESGKKREEQKKKWSRLKAFDAWIWKSFYLELNAVKLGKKSYNDSLTKCEKCHDLYWRDEKHCKICHTTFELDFDLEERYTIHAATCRENRDADMFPKHKVLSSQLQSLKAAVHSIESVMPEGALIGAWSKSAHRLWVKRLRRCSSVAELLHVLADFIGAINREWLFPCDPVPGCDFTGEEMVAYFPSIPQTSSAVALWLVRLDMLLAPHIERARSDKNQQLLLT